MAGLRGGSEWMLTAAAYRRRTAAGCSLPPMTTVYVEQRAVLLALDAVPDAEGRCAPVPRAAQIKPPLSRRADDASQ
jgi:hypothetical protein